MFPKEQPPIQHPPALDRWEVIKRAWRWFGDAEDRKVGIADFKATRLAFDRCDAAAKDALETDPTLHNSVRG